MTPTREKNLFQLGEFISSSGLRLPFKIECDALTDADWECCAFVATKILPPFNDVLFVPTGGFSFAKALEPYIDPRARHTLIADDVLTTGKSMNRIRMHHRLRVHEAVGVALFSHKQTDIGGWIDEWIRPLWRPNYAIG